MKTYVLTISFFLLSVLSLLAANISLVPNGNNYIANGNVLTVESGNHTVEEIHVAAGGTFIVKNGATVTITTELWTDGPCDVVIEEGGVVNVQLYYQPLGNFSQVNFVINGQLNVNGAIQEWGYNTTVTFVGTGSLTAASSTGDFNFPDDNLLVVIGGVVVNGSLVGITVSPSSLTVSEDGTSTFSVVLDAAPTSSVTITVLSDDTDECTVPSTTLAFTPSNWDQEQTVTVTGVDEGQVDGNQTGITITAAVSQTNDANYTGESATVNVTVNDATNPDEFYWTGNAGDGLFETSGNWSINSNPKDVSTAELIFDDGGTHNVGSIPTTAIASISVSNNTKVSLGSSGQTLGFNTAISIESGSQVTLDNIVLSINNTAAASVAGKLNALPNASINLSGDLTVTGDLVLNADATGTANLLAAGTVTGNVTVEVYYIAKLWNDVAVPLKESTNPFSKNFWSYNETKADYWNITDFEGQGEFSWNKLVAGDPIYSTTAYSYYTWGSTVRAYTGEVETNTKSIPVTHTNNGAGFVDFDGWNLVPNPYACSIDWDAVYSANSGLIADFVYYWKGEQYAAYQEGTSIPNPLAGTGTEVIPSTQGFWIVATGNGQITIPSTARVLNTNVRYKNKGTGTKKEVVRFSISGNGYTDEAMVSMFKGVTTGFDKKSDAPKKYSYKKQIPHIYTVLPEENIELAINSVPNNEDLSIPIGIATQKPGEYILDFMNVPFDGYTQYYLEDKYTGELHSVYEGFSLNVTTTTAITNDRFVLVKSTMVTGFEDAGLENSQVKIYSFGNSIFIENSIGNAIIQLYDMAGRKVHQSIVNKTKGEIELNEKAGIYLVNYISNGNSTQHKVIITK